MDSRFNGRPTVSAERLRTSVVTMETNGDEENVCAVPVLRDAKQTFQA